MSRTFPLLLSAVMAVAFGAAPELKQVKRVYFLQMTGGMDQYLAQHLVQHNTIEVVTDPALADAVFSDRIGESLEQKWAEMYPPPAKEKDDEDKDAAKAAGPISSGPIHALSSWGRGRGNIYLIDRNSKRVVWSSFRKPKNSTARELDRTAARIAARLRDDLKPAAPVTR